MTIEEAKKTITEIFTKYNCTKKDFYYKLFSQGIISKEDDNSITKAINTFTFEDWDNNKEFGKIYLEKMSGGLMPRCEIIAIDEDGNEYPI